MLRRLAIAAPLIFLLTARVPAAEFFVAPTGNDANAGTIEKPFASVQRAQSAVAPGDVVNIRGGTYALTEKQMARKERIFAYVTYLDKSGTPDHPITYQAYQDERPVFDLSAIKPPLRVDAFYVPASYLHLKRLEVVGVQVTIKTHTQSICFANDGSHNVYERLSMHDGQAIGIYSIRGSDNLFLNCDAYRNWDYTSENGRGGNVDGFGCHPTEGGTGNVFRGCRAWFNSDDGYDCINAHESVTFEHCWSMYNGLNEKRERLGDGNGFKAGGYGATPVDRLPNPIPRHVVRFCLAVGNRANGFYTNHHIGGDDLFNNTAFHNSINFNMLCRLSDNRTDVDGYGHKLRNNVSYNSRSDIARIDISKCDSKNNSWDLGLRLTDGDFLSVDEKELIGPRQANGDLPVIHFLHPSANSALLGKAIDVPDTKDLGALQREVLR